MVLGGGAVSYEQGTPVWYSTHGRENNRLVLGSSPNPTGLRIALPEIVSRGQFGRCPIKATSAYKSTFENDPGERNSESCWTHGCWRGYPSQWPSQIGPLIFVSLFRNFSVQRRLNHRHFDRGFGQNRHRIPLCVCVLCAVCCDCVRVLFTVWL